MPRIQCRPLANVVQRFKEQNICCKMLKKANRPGQIKSQQQCNLYGLMSLSTHCIGYIRAGSFKGRGNQYILVGDDSAL